MQQVPPGRDGNAAARDDFLAPTPAVAQEGFTRRWQVENL